MKNYLYITAGLLASFLAFQMASAATTDFVANGDITVSSVTGDGAAYDMTVVNGSTAESWAFTDGAFTVTNPDSTNPFVVTSSNSSVLSLQVYQSGSRLSCSANSTPGTTSVTLPTSSGTYTVIPSPANCSAPSSSSSSSSGSGSSGSSRSQAAQVPTVPLIQPAPAPRAVPSGVIFARGFSVGMSGNDVKHLQQFLNNNGFTVAIEGPGSPGNETLMFGRLTRNALIRFQIQKGVIKDGTDAGAGYLGPKTRAAINSVK